MMFWRSTQAKPLAIKYQRGDGRETPFTRESGGRLGNGEEGTTETGEDTHLRTLLRGTSDGAQSDTGGGERRETEGKIGSVSGFRTNKIVLNVMTGRTSVRCKRGEAAEQQPRQGNKASL
ncbi:hypothetical protein FKM82_024022 [Ascaphus truei]